MTASIVRFLTFIILLTTSSLCAHAAESSDIEVAFINPVGFLAPGSKQYLYLSVSNPADSTLTITGLDDFEETMLELPGAITFIQPERCYSQLGCFDSVRTDVMRGSFPLGPGESLVMAFGEISAATGLLLGDVLGYEQLIFSFSSIDGAVDVLSSNNVVYVVSEHGIGDDSIFDEYDIYAPEVDFMQLEADYHYPAELEAGQHFNLRVTLTNTGDVSITDYRRPGRTGSADRPLGIDEELFQFQGCFGDCILGGQMPLEPGDSITLEIGNFYYKHSQLVSQVMEAQPFEFRIWDGNGINLFATGSSEPTEIVVTGPSGGAVPNPAETLPNRTSMQVQDLISSGDELILRDPNTGYDWISPEASKGFPYAYMMELLAEHPDLAGFELAKRRQVEELLLNHIHSQNVEAAFYDIGKANENVNDAVFGFASLFGAITVESNSFFNLPPSKNLYGVIADSPRLYVTVPNVDVPVSTLTVTAYTEYGPSSFISRTGYSAVWESVLEKNSVQDNPKSYGYWLVRTHEELPVVEGARLMHDELILPSIQVGQEYFTATMKYTNRLRPYLELTSLELLENALTQVYASYNLQDDTLTVPELHILNSDGEFDRVHAEVLRAAASFFKIIEVVGVE